MCLVQLQPAAPGPKTQLATCEAARGAAAFVPPLQPLLLRGLLRTTLALLPGEGPHMNAAIR